MRYDFEIESDHFQVLIGDRVHGPRVDTTRPWDHDHKVAALPGVTELVAIGTTRFGGKTRVLIEVASSEPESSDEWSEMGDFVLDIRSGELLLWAPESPDLERLPVVSLDPGRYVGRAFSRATERVSDEMATEGSDEYLVALWRAS